MVKLPKFRLLYCFIEAAVVTVRHDGIEHAGYLAFLGLLAMFPFLVFTFAIIGVLGQGAAGATLINDVLHALPEHVAEGLLPRVTEIVSGPPQGLLTVSILGAIWTASSAVEGLRTILNRAYHVATPPAYWFRRSLSVLQFLLFTFILIAGMLLVVTIPLLLQHLEARLGIHFISEHQQYWGNVLFFVSAGLLFFTICAVYYTIPNMRQSFLSVAPGALIVVLAWLGAAQLFSIYLSHFDQVNIIYGSLGGIIAALIFFYICNVIFIYGAEFNHQIVVMLNMAIQQKEKAQQEEESSGI